MTEIKTGSNEFYMEESGEVFAKIQYVESGQDVLTVTHTIVNDSHSGEGLGKKLVDRMAEFAMEENKKIIPQCSYAKHVLESDEKYKDVLA